MLKNFDDGLREKWGSKIIFSDEAGRGAWAGPIVAAAVSLPEDFNLLGLDDSKKLSEKKRHEFYDIIMESAIWSVHVISAKDIDENGIDWANAEVMQRACIDVREKIQGVDLYVLDQSPKNNLSPKYMFPKADGTSLGVAAASVLAKVYRDNFMNEWHEKYPNYNISEEEFFEVIESISKI